MPKNQVGGAEDPIVNHFYKIVNRVSTEVKRNYLATNVLGYSYCPPAETHANFDKLLEKDIQISKHHLLSQGEN